MESTGVYWIPVYEISEVHGLSVVLANARDCKAAPGRKSDVNDAQWSPLQIPQAPHESLSFDVFARNPIPQEESIRQ